MPPSQPFSRAMLRHPLRRLGHSRSSHSGPPRGKPEPPLPTPGSGQVPIPGPAPAPLRFWQRLGPLTRAVEAYNRSQRTRPYLTQLTSAFVIYLIADTSAQGISGRDYEVSRSMRTVFIGTLAAIPHYKWVLYLSRNFNYSSLAMSVAAKTLINQILLPPLFNTYFFGMQALLSGEDMAATIERIKNTVPVSLVNSWKFWPTVNAFSFVFVPMEHRAVFSNIISIGWQTYLSFLNRQAEARQHKETLNPPELLSEVVPLTVKNQQPSPAP